MIRVLIRASSRFAKAGLTSLLKSHHGLRLLDDVPEDGVGMEAGSRFDVMLAEADTLADATAREAMDWARAGGPAVLLLRDPAAEVVREALQAGVKAVLPSGSDGPEIAAAIEAAAAGLVVLHPVFVDTFVPARGAFPSETSAAVAEELTARELQVLRLVAAGLGNKEIAGRLEISEHTVKFHVASIMGKLGAGSRTEAVTLAIRRGSIMI
jgi:DNA-binding NarL/FixJ family response regulator